MSSMNLESLHAHSWSLPIETVASDATAVHLPSVGALRTVDHHLYIPIEIFEQIIDIVADANEDMQRRRDLWACALTCRAWFPRSRALLYLVVLLRDQRELLAFAQTLDAHPVLGGLTRRLHIWGRSLGDEVEVQREHASLMTQFPATLAGKLARAEHLTIQYIQFFPISDDAAFFRVLSELTSVTTLRLAHLQFTSLQQVVRILCAFPSLKTLQCKHVNYLSRGLDLGLAVTASAAFESLDLCFTSDQDKDILDVLVSVDMLTRLKHLNVTITLQFLVGSDLSRIVHFARETLQNVHLQLRDNGCLGNLGFSVIDYLVERHLKPFGPHISNLDIAICDKNYCGWVVQLFSYLSADKVHGVRLEIDIQPGESTVDGHLNVFSAAEWAMIDRYISKAIESSKHEGELKLVLQCYDPPSLSGKTEVAMRERLAIILPMLHEQGRILVLID